MKSKTFSQTMALALLLPLLALAPLVVHSPAQGSMAVAFLNLEGSLAYSAWAGIGVAIAGMVGVTIGLALRWSSKKSH
jgi:multidrug transporter EmrE-like cation transporter